MSDKCDLCLLGLIILCSLLTGTSGVNETHVFFSSGEDVRLPCNNALSDCNSTTWTYSSFRHSGTVELITLGKKKKDTERHERLSLGSDCSLNIKNVTKEDPGFYTCQQYVNEQKQGTDARVSLHVLHVSSSSSSSSSSQTEISPGRSVTLSCQLYSYDGESCDRWARFEEIHLLWVNQAGVDLTTDSRYQISASGVCIITLTTTLLKEDDNSEWRCRLTHRNQNKTSVRYTVKYSAQDVTTTAVIPVHTTNSQDPSTIKTPETKAQDVTTTAVIPVHTTNSQDPSTIKTPETKVVPSTTATSLIPETTPNSLKPVSLSVIGIVGASFTVLLLALILWVILKKRADNRRRTDDSVEQRDDHVTYTEVTVCSKNQGKKKVHCDDKVTYSSIRGAKVGAPENCSELYASVNKNHHS
ncbi:uncharacterized protein LOC125261933 isoform X2 [Megalobrama amblycephala]|uniref:uncharacterized protein LOC125261933 isoform X2 n=1 Tax=Megalobrama amblycephala TaxID=75352 RepID=UPI002013E384|nr:uncharacterized protein LOC125261933 isoform X2 [Megalobrama amblycephala]